MLRDKKEDDESVTCVDDGRIQKCRGSKRTWHRHKNNKMSEKFKRMNKKKRKKTRDNILQC